MATSTTKSSPTKSSQTKSTAATLTSVTRVPSRDGIVLLKADHAEVKKCFKEYAKLVKNDAQDSQRSALALKICEMLSVHAKIEEEIFYPAARELLNGEAMLVDEADVEHTCAKQLIEKIRNSKADDQHFDARIKVLSEYIEHHVREEEDELFPTVKSAGMDTKAIGQKLSVLKASLMENALG